MSKIITFRVNDDEQILLDEAVRKYNHFHKGDYALSDIVKKLIKSYVEFKEGVKIPSNKVTKDELAAFLNIGRLDKRWVTFMDKIEKTYYE